MAVAVRRGMAGTGDDDGQALNKCLVLLNFSGFCLDSDVSQMLLLGSGFI